MAASPSGAVPLDATIVHGCFVPWLRLNLKKAMSKGLLGLGSALRSLSLVSVSEHCALRAKNTTGRLLVLLAEAVVGTRPPSAFGVEMPKERLRVTPVRQVVEGVFHHFIVRLSTLAGLFTIAHTI